MFKKPILLSIILLSLGLFGLAPLAELAETKKETPPPGSITFFAKNTVAKANGTFKKWSITESTFDLENPAEAVIVISVDVASIDTKIAKRDNHLRTADFFDVEKYPAATLKIYEVKKTKSGDTYTAKLDFNLHGVKKTFPKLEFRVVQRDPVKVEGKFTFNRLDFKIGKPKTLNPMSITEDIPITFSATLPAK
ncbi:MAG: YceI family protein [Candidatus Hydrogenedentota bacterium]